MAFIDFIMLWFEIHVNFRPLLIVCASRSRRPLLEAGRLVALWPRLSVPHYGFGDAVQQQPSCLLQRNWSLLAMKQAPGCLLQRNNSSPAVCCSAIAGCLRCNSSLAVCCSAIGVCLGCNNSPAVCHYASSTWLRSTSRKLVCAVCGETVARLPGPAVSCIATAV